MKKLLLTSLLTLIPFAVNAGYFAEVHKTSSDWKLIKLSSSSITPRENYDYLQLDNDGTISSSTLTSSKEEVGRLERDIDLSRFVSEYEQAENSFNHLKEQQADSLESINNLNHQLWSEYSSLREDIQFKLTVTDKSGLYKRGLTAEQFVKFVDEKPDISSDSLEFLNETFLSQVNPENKSLGGLKHMARYEQILKGKTVQVENFLKSRYSYLARHTPIDCSTPAGLDYKVLVKCTPEVDLLSNNKTVHVHVTVLEKKEELNLTPGFIVEDGLLKISSNEPGTVLIQNIGYSDLTEVKLSLVLGENALEHSISSLSSGNTHQWQLPGYSEMTTYYRNLTPRLKINLVANYNHVGKEYSLDYQSEYRRAFLFTSDNK